MGLKNLQCYTYDDFIEMLESPEDFGNKTGFLERVSKLPYSISTILTWEGSHFDDFFREGQKSKIKNWIQEQNLNGNVNFYWTCQIEFENEHDALAFKLAWS